MKCIHFTLVTYFFPCCLFIFVIFKSLTKKRNSESILQIIVTDVIFAIVSCYFWCVAINSITKFQAKNLPFIINIALYVNICGYAKGRCGEHNQM